MGLHSWWNIRHRRGRLTRDLVDRLWLKQQAPAAVGSRLRGNDGYALGNGVVVALAQVVHHELILQIPYYLTMGWARIQRLVIV
jgi:hypothetical protein